MTSGENFSWLASIACCLLLLFAGCAPPSEEAVEPTVAREAEPEVELKAEPEKQIPKAEAPEAVPLALRFTEQDLTTYRVSILSERSVKFEGPLPEKNAFKGGRASSRLEMTFTQRRQSADDKGGIIADITIKGLKFLGVVKDDVVEDFDSSRAKDQNSPLAKLIGQTYTLEIAPTGEVTEIIDVQQIQAAVMGSSSAHRTALGLLKPDIIKERHGMMLLPDADKNRLRTNDKWSRTRVFSFGMMGAKSYERVYTLKGIEDRDGQQIAVVEMNAIPSSEMAEELYKEQAASALSKMFDNTETYAGRLELDLTAGKIERYLEKLQSQWITVEPFTGQQSDREPAALKMGVIRLYSLEKID